MLGTPARQELKTKGAESWGMMVFLMDTMAVRQHKLGPEGARLREAGQAFVALVGIITTSGATLSEPTVGRCYGLWERIMNLTASIEALHRPKRHVFCHVVSRLAG